MSLESKNIPYVRQYDENGSLIKTGTIRSKYPNRESRRDRQPRPFNNSKNKTVIIHRLSAIEMVKVRQVYQFVSGKKIPHLIIS